MADTFSMTEASAEAPELNAEEQDSLAVGQQLQEEQSDLLAGKYKSAKDLEDAYIELQKKLGSQSEETTEEAVEPEPEPEELSATSFLNDASNEYAENGELSAETMSKLTEMSSEDLVKAYIESQAGQQSAATDLTEKQVSSIKDSVGGEEQYNTLVSWAGENLEQKSIQGFDALVETGNAAAIEFAVAGLKAMYETQNGSEGQMVTGKTANTTGEQFKSREEVVEAMGDPRYDRDPAYRNEIMEKLARSSVSFRNA